MSGCAHKPQRHWISLELELQVVISHPMWGLGTKLWSSARSVDTQPLSHLSRPLTICVCYMSLKSNNRLKDYVCIFFVQGVYCISEGRHALGFKPKYKEKPF